MENLSPLLKKMNCHARDGVREIASRGTRSATGKIAKVVRHARKQLAACHRPLFQGGAMLVTLTTSEAGMIYKAVESAMTTAAGWAVLVQEEILGRSLPTSNLFGVAGLQEPLPSILLAEHCSPGTSTNAQVRVQLHLRRHLQQHRMFLAHLVLNGPRKSCVSCEPKSTASSMKAIECSASLVFRQGCLYVYISN